MTRGSRSSTAGKTAPAFHRRARSRSQAQDRSLEASLQAQPPTLLQDRARRSYESLLNAAERLFARDGYDAVGTPEIADQAGVSVGTFYRYFNDKKQVYLEIVRRHLLSVFRETVDRLTPEHFIGKARHETIDETVGILFEYVSRHPKLNRVLVEMSMRDPDVAKLRVEFEAASCQRLALLLAAICPSSTIPDPEATAWILQATALECANGIGGGSGHPPMAAARVRSALTTMIERLLFPVTDR